MTRTGAWLAAAALLLALGSSTPEAQRTAVDAPLLRLARAQLLVVPPLQESPADKPGSRQVSSVDVDRQGNVYILQRGVTNPITVTDRTGRVLRSWGAGLFTLPHGVRVDNAGNVWTTDANTSMVYKFSATGTMLLRIDVASHAPTYPNTERWVADPMFVGTTDVAFAPDGHVFVSDGYGNARVVEFDANGRFVREWGRPGRGPGEFRLPHGIAVGPDGNVYVADRENGRVERFTRDGRFLGEWTFGDRLYSIDFGLDGNLYLGHRPAGASGPTEGRILEVNPATGAILGQIPSPIHFVAAAADHSLFAGMQNGHVAAFRPAP